MFFKLLGRLDRSWLTFVIDYSGFRHPSPFSMDVVDMTLVSINLPLDNLSLERPTAEELIKNNRSIY